MLDAERARVLEIRNAGQVASEVVTEVLAMLDVEESMLDIAQASREELQDRVPRRAAYRRHAATTSTSRPVEGRAGARAGLPAVRRRGLHVGLAAPVPGLRPRRLLRLLGTRHATAHFRETTHPVMQSAEPLRGLALVLRAPRHRLTRVS